MSEQDLKEIQIEDEIFQMLVTMGISPRLRGFRLLEYCIKQAVRRRRLDEPMLLYKNLAEKLDESWTNVVRAMRFAIRKAENTCGREKITQMIGVLPVEKGRIEPVTFCEICARRIRRKLYDLQ